MPTGTIYYVLGHPLSSILNEFIVLVFRNEIREIFVILCETNCWDERAKAYISIIKSYFVGYV